MIEHPIPQNVSAYQFHLVGDMTLKQFLELASGIVLAWLVWSLGLPTILKLPLTIFFALFGFALAFLPLEDRPLDQWVISFLKAIYGPTILTWKKAKHDDLLEFKRRAQDEKTALATALKSPAAGLESLLAAYQTQATTTVEAPDPLEEPWKTTQQNFTGLFSTVVVPKKLTLETTYPRKLDLGPTRPKTKVVPHPLSPPENPQAIKRGEITIKPRHIKIPPQTSLSALTDVPPSAQQGQTNASPQPASPGTLPTSEEVGATGTSVPSGVTASSMSLPIAPSGPNVISGIIFAPDGQVVPDTIIEIRDQDQVPVRALKTNQLGQFSVATPLPNGSFTLAVEKEGLSFGILKFDTNGSVIPAIEIRAQASNEQK